MDVANIIIIILLILILAWVINYFFLITNIVFDQMLEADGNVDNKDNDSNRIKNEDLKDNSTANFMLSVWFYIDNWNTNIETEKNILFLHTSATAETVPELKDSNINISKKHCLTNTDTYKNLSVSLGKYENKLNIDIETIKGADDSSGCFTRYIIKNISIQKWNCLIISVDTKTMDVYLDGKLRNSFILHQPYQNKQDNNIYLGMHSSYSPGFKGFITRVRYEPNSINPKEAYNIYKDGIDSSLAKTMFNKYRLKVSFLEYNNERGSFTI